MTTADSFGDIRKFPVLRILCEISDGLIQSDHVYGRKQRGYVSKLIKEYNRVRRLLSKLDKTEQKYVSGLIKDEFLKRVNASTMDEKLKKPVQNYLIGVHRNFIVK
jgi:hypothetical protein